MEYTIRQVSEMTGLPASTLRYYESEKLLPAIARNDAGRRIYDEQALDRISLITCLRDTDMPLGEIKTFVTLCAIGDETLEEHRKMMLTHKKAVERRIAELQHQMDHINFKVNYYNAACEAGTEAQLKSLKYPDSIDCCSVFLHALKK